MARKPTKKQLHFSLVEVVQATQEGSFVYTDKDTHEPLIKAGHVEINPDMVDDEGCLATRATQSGIDFIQNQSNTESQSDVPSEPETKQEKVKSMEFQIEKNVAIPSVTGRGKKESSYPFDDMEVGDSFFVPETEDRPNPAKSLASTVSSANARYAEETGEVRKNRAGNEVPATRQTRKYVVRSVAGGARVWRVEV